ncbi:hypothetical protein HYU22_00095 [Candidatus Woesearchaeota archaeon]|nr:hypothetical protein [Candidatus Woesearchaeota archaeon]
MQNEKPYEQVIRTNQEILDNLCRDMRIIAAYGNISPALKKRLYSAEYWAKYFMGINNGLIQQYWGEKR